VITVLAVLIVRYPKGKININMIDFEAERLSIENYNALHNSVINPLNIKIDIDSFHNSMQKYKYAFRSWGEKKKHFLRYGLPLVNENGSMYNNPEPVCYPLDEWIEGFTYEQKLPFKHYDRCFTSKTEVLDEPCFEPLMSTFGDYLLRSCILRWDEPAFFYPHTDTEVPSPILRLWGTSEPDVVKIRFDKQRRRVMPHNVSTTADIDVQDFEDFEIEPGRLYLMDTSIIHAARSLVHRSTYQFFIALHSDSYNKIRESKI